MIVSATQLKVTSLFGLLRFIPVAKNTRLQLDQVEGLVFAKVKGFYTLTGWENREAMKSFRNSGHHLEAMKTLKRIGKAKSVTWETDSEPDWKEAKARLRGVEF